jgi:hypothetical protein
LVDALRHAADVWGSKSLCSCPGCHRNDLAQPDDLVLRMKAWGVNVGCSFLAFGNAFRSECRTPFSAYFESWRDEDRARTGRAARELDGSGPQGQRECGFAPQPARIRATTLTIMKPASLTIMYPAPIGPVELPIVEIANCNGDRQAGPKQLLWSVEDRTRCCPRARGYQQVGSLAGTSGGQCGQLGHQ